MTLPSRSTERSSPRRSWLVRLRPGRGSGARPGSPRADHGLWTVDRVVRALTTACHEETREVPAVHAVVVGAETVRLYLSTPDERPPADWVCEQDGRVWHAPLRRLQSVAVSDTLPDPYPQLVSLGGSHEGFVLLNLARAGGIIALEGDARQARLLAQDWTRELTSSPWSREVKVARIGFKTGPAGPDDIIEAKSLGHAASTLAGIDGAVLILAGPPDGRAREFLHRVAEDPSGRWTVVVLGRMEQPRWRLVLDAEGMVDTGFLAEPVSRRLDQVSALPGPEESDADSGPAPAAVPRPRPSAPARPATPAGPGDGRRFSRRTTMAAAAAAVAVVVVAVVLTTTHRGSSPAAPVARATTEAGTAATAPGSAPTTAGAGGSGTPAPGAPSGGPVAPPAGSSLVNPAANKCLSAGPGTDGTPLSLAACDGDANQSWQAVNGTLQSQGLCMDAAWGATTPGTVVQVARCSGNPAQLFSVRGGTVYSQQAKLCIGEANGGTAVRLAPCTGPASVFKRP
ncbi:ricin-type beta-trefoil lectin domain protein [Streptomyces sp. NPDC096198]|uniref:RICIN domain-containing protein n=1 Tax=Streptomyces sp. NPDC096198 TaxID=3366080 RepID=UPI00380115B6